MYFPYSRDNGTPSLRDARDNTDDEATMANIFEYAKLCGDDIWRTNADGTCTLVWTNPEA